MTIRYDLTSAQYTKKNVSVLLPDIHIIEFNNVRFPRTGLFVPWRLFYDISIQRTANSGKKYLEDSFVTEYQLYCIGPAILTCANCNRQNLNLLVSTSESGRKACTESRKSYDQGPYTIQRRRQPHPTEYQQKH